MSFDLSGGDPGQSEPAETAPPGFTRVQWERFEREGYLTLTSHIPLEDVAHYRRAVERCGAGTWTHPQRFRESRRVEGSSAFEQQGFAFSENIVERDPVFESLIDHPRHVGFAYDLYGEQLMFQRSELMIRPPDGPRSIWHFDGPRALPYQVFSPRLPLQIKISYWLTDLHEPQMGNLVIRPGSHHESYSDGYDTHEPQSDELVLCPKAGDMTIWHCGLWHRVQANRSGMSRKNIFLSYCPSWIASADRYQSDADWIQKLPRTRRILMRSYGYPYDRAKPPTDDFPLFLDRETGEGYEGGCYPAHIPLHRRKRRTQVEKW